MPNRYFINGGVNNNWGSTTNWSSTSGGVGGSSIPTSVDAVFFNASSPNCSIDTSNRECLSLDCTGYSNTLTFSKGLTVSGGITISNTMTISGTNSLCVNSNSVIQTNGKIIPLPVYLSGTISVTLPSQLIISSTFSILTGSKITFTGSYGWSASSFTIETFGKTHSFKSGVTYSISSKFISESANNNERNSLISDTSGQYFNFTLNSSATQKVSFTNVSWVDSSNGQSIYSFNGNITNSINWIDLNSQLMGLKNYSGTFIAI